MLNTLNFLKCCLNFILQILICCILIVSQPKIFTNLLEKNSSTAVLFRGVLFNFQVLRDLAVTSLLLIPSLY